MRSVEYVGQQTFTVTDREPEPPGPVFLAPPASDYVNGITLPVDGGWLDP